MSDAQFKILLAVWKRKYCSCNICHFRLLQFIRGTFLQKVFFVLAACETCYARGLKQMQLAAEYSLHNQTVSISGPHLDYDPIIKIEANVRDAVTGKFEWQVLKSSHCGSK